MSRYFVVPDFLLKFGDVKDVPISQGQGNNFNSILERVYLKNKEKQDNLIKSYMQKIGKLRGAYDSIFPNSETNKKMLSYLSSNFESMVDDLVKYTYDNPYDYETINGRIGELTNLLKNDTLLNKFKHDQNVLKQGRVPIVTSNGDMQYLSANPQVVKGPDGNNYVVVDGKPVPEDIYRGLLKGQLHIQQQQGQPQTVSQQGTGSVAQQSGTRQGQGTTVNTTPAGTQVVNYPPYNPQVYNGQNGRDGKDGVNGTQDINIKVSLDGLNLTEAQRKLLEQQGIVSDNGVGVKDFDSNSQVLGKSKINIPSKKEAIVNSILKEIDKLRGEIIQSELSGIKTVTYSVIRNDKYIDFLNFLNQLSQITGEDVSKLQAKLTKVVTKIVYKNNRVMSELEKQFNELGLDYQFNEEIKKVEKNAIQDTLEFTFSEGEDAEYIKQNYIINKKMDVMQDILNRYNISDTYNVNITTGLNTIGQEANADFSIVDNNDPKTVNFKKLEDPESVNDYVLLNKIGDYIQFDEKVNKYNKIEFIKKLFYTLSQAKKNNASANYIGDDLENLILDELEKKGIKFDNKSVSLSYNTFINLRYLNPDEYNEKNADVILEVLLKYYKEYINNYKSLQYENINGRIKTNNPYFDQDTVSKVQTFSSTASFNDTSLKDNNEEKKDAKSFMSIYNKLKTLKVAGGNGQDKIETYLNNIFTSHGGIKEIQNKSISYYEVDGKSYYRVNLDFTQEGKGLQRVFVTFEDNGRISHPLLDSLKKSYKIDAENNNKYNYFINENTTAISQLNSFREFLINKKHSDTYTINDRYVIYKTFDKEKGKEVEHRLYNKFIIDGRLFTMEMMQGEPALVLRKAKLTEQAGWVVNFNNDIENAIKDNFKSFTNLYNTVLSLNHINSEKEKKQKLKDIVVKLHGTFLKLKPILQNNVYTFNNYSKELELIDKFSNLINNNETFLEKKETEELLSVTKNLVEIIYNISKEKQKIYNSYVVDMGVDTNYYPIPISNYLEAMIYHRDSIISPDIYKTTLEERNNNN